MQHEKTSPTHPLIIPILTEWIEVPDNMVLEWIDKTVIGLRYEFEPVTSIRASVLARVTQDASGEDILYIGSSLSSLYPNNETDRLAYMTILKEINDSGQFVSEGSFEFLPVESGHLVRPRWFTRLGRRALDTFDASGLRALQQCAIRAGTLMTQAEVTCSSIAIRLGTVH